MSDDLVKRLRDAADRAKREYPEVFRVSEEITYEAADRIEKLETNFQLQLEWYLSNKRVLDDRIKKLEAALREIAAHPEPYRHADEMAIIARCALDAK